MKTRLHRPLLAAVIAGAVVAGGAVYTNPAFAAPTPAATAAAADETTDPTVDPTATDPTPDPTATTDPTPDPTATTDPTPDPTATTDPTPDPTATTDPTPDPTTPPATDPTPDPTTPSPTEPTGDPTTSPTASPTNAPDTTAPTGAFKLSVFSLWVGQKTTLSLVGINDDHGAAGVTRVVSWGDGTTTKLSLTTTAVTKQYTRTGRFPISLTLTDAAGNRRVVNSAVTVTVPGKFKLNKTSVWHGERFTVAISSVPTGTTRIVLNSGDGYSAVLRGKNQTVTEYYYHRYKGALMPAGPVTLTAVFTNKNGSTTPIVVGKVTIKRDVWSPRVTITKPKKSNRASSWKTIRGTATDKGSGIPDLIVIVLRQSGSKVYCYTPKKTWMRIYASTNLAKCFNIRKVSKGKWSLSVKGQKKKTKLDVIAVGADWADRTSNTAERVAKLTRS